VQARTTVFGRRICLTNAHWRGIASRSDSLYRANISFCTVKLSGAFFGGGKNPVV